MGPLIRRRAHRLGRVGLLCWAAGGGTPLAAAAPALALRSPDARAVVGVEDSLELVVHDDGVPVEALPGVLALSDGQLRAPPVPIGPGRWLMRWTPPLRPGPVVVQVGELSAALEVEAIGAPPAGGPALAVALRSAQFAGGGEPVELLVSGPAGLRAEDLVVAVSEGEVGPVRLVGVSDANGSVKPEEGARFSVSWALGTAPYARPALVAVADRRAPTTAPALGVVSVRARPSVPVQTQPGVEVELELGRRRYGPFVAGGDGIARAQLEVRPGETLATVLLRDKSGRTSTSTLSLAGDQRPVMVALSAGARARDPQGMVAWVAVLDADGSPAGGAPSCARSDRAATVVQPLRPGLFAVTGPSTAADDPADLLLDCSVGVLARAAARVPRAPAAPSRLHVRMSPTELEADAPLARVVVTAESAAGERLSAEDIRLVAEFGRLELQRDAFALRADYDGVAALAQGADRLRASWAPPVGAGSVIEISVQGAVTGDGIAELLVRARGADGQRLVGVPVRLWMEGAEPFDGITDAQGALRLRVPVPAAGPIWVEAVAEGRRARQLLLIEPALVDREDLAWTVEHPVPIFAGRVRSVSLSAEPPTVETGANASARVRVRLADAAGSPVDAPVELRASVGRIGEVRRRPDGSYEAIYEPGEAFSAQSARITASSPSGAFAETVTEIALTPKVLRLAPGLQVGWLVGADGPSSPYGGLSADLQLRSLGPNLYLRLSGGLYSDAAEGSGAALDLTVLPLAVGADVRRSRGRTSTWAGAAAVAAPYWLRASLDGRSLGGGAGLAGPGVQLFSGGGLRRKNAELGLEIAWTFLTIPDGDLSWQGSVGGLGAAFTYRLLY